MSIRIHELAKKIGMDNKELLSLLKTRNFDVKSVSSTVDNISAEAIEQEFAPKSAPATEPAAGPAQAAQSAAAESKSGGGTAVAIAPDMPQSFTTKVPLDAFVKTAEGVRREKEEAARAAAPKPPVLPARPATPSAPLRPITPMRATETASPPAIKFAPPAAPLRPAAVAPASVPLAKVSSPLPPPSAPMRMAPPATPAVPAAPVVPVVTQVGDVKIIHLKPPIIVRDFATALSLKPFKLISELMEMGIFASMTQSLDEAIAAKLAEKHGFLLEIKHRGDVAAQQAAKEKEKEKQTKPEVADPTKLVARPPVVCILGHVDHGKTSLLDAIRKANVASGEAGGITQHIGAYQIEFNGRKVTFLDTPGHAAFNKMRARGASVTDIAVLVVAADDGFMPQTDEALQHVKEAQVTLLVAVNKMDTKGANLDRVKGQMQERGIPPEDWGGEVVTVPVSAIKGTGINELLEMILLQADVLELKADPKAEPAGAIIESQVDVGRGPVATVIIESGTLKIGDAIVCGPHWAKVRAMFDDQGRALKEAPPATPVRIIGWSSTPDSGAVFQGVKNAREAEKLAEEEQQRLRATSVTEAAPKEISVDQLFANIAATQEKVVKVIIKTDVFGSAEAVRNILEGIKSTKISLEIVSAEVGLITKNDVLMASAAGSIILGFNTKLENGVTPLAKHHGVRIETFEIIYELNDKVREMMADLLDPDLKEIKTGAAEVRATFPLAKGFVAGCLVTEGKVNRNASARLHRGKEILHEGKVAALKRFKDDANEVRAGLECGIKLDDFNDYQAGDVIECYEVQKIRAAL
ncbi:MAG: translation initiation factor IF-2 [Opitutaceae bacterium]|jgi:translation initiation factor IF-2